MDVKIALFYSDIQEDIWIELPIGCSVTSITTTKLNKAPYSLK
jgi:hypothetical protein